MKPIMLATDGSPSAQAATTEAIGLAQALDVPLVVASVAHDSTPMYGGYYGFPEVAAELRRTQFDHVAEVLATVEQQATDAGVPCTTLSLKATYDPGGKNSNPARDSWKNRKKSSSCPSRNVGIE